MTRTFHHFNMKEQILKLGQMPFLFAIKELELQEKYEQCEYAKKQLQQYCEYYRINMRSIEGYEVQNEKHMKQLTDIAIEQIETSYKNK